MLRGVLAFILLHACRTCCRSCQVIDIALTKTSTKQVNAQKAFIRLSLPPSALTVVDLTTDEALDRLVVILSSGVVQGQDFRLVSLAKENSLPSEYRKSRRFSVGLHLLPGKRWIQERNNSSPIPLYVVNVYVCSDTSSRQEFLLVEAAAPANTSSSSSSSQGWVQIAEVSSKALSCPKLPPLPDASPALSSLINSILEACQMPRIIKSKRLDWRKVTSFSLLSLQPPLLFVDGSDQSLSSAAQSVDAFLAAHSVLKIAWEPYNESEPRYWILAPYPQGMPGHLFAMVDTLQWTHPYVADGALLRSQPLCNASYAGCVPGCPKTRLMRITGSGWGADTHHVMVAFQRFFMDFTPMQVSPVKLGYRVTPPLWGGTIGWLFTYGGCSSNFLDCYFLDHSPCPIINMDAQDHPGESALDKSRLTSAVPSNHLWKARPDWWPKVMGSPSAVVPESSIGDMHGLPAKHVLYSYFFRPNYSIRKEVYKASKDVRLDNECAVMHVRRGDSIMHTGQARGYLRVDSYVRAAQPLMKALGVNTIFLVTDSQAAVEEAKACATSFPDVCAGIEFRFLEKKRWVGAEGGWENPFPSGSSRTEFLAIQLEFALAQKCSMAIVGDSNYADKIMAHMCCGFPLSFRGSLPRRCVCPPSVRLQQGGFDCKKGNEIDCDKHDKGGDITKPLDDPGNMYAANFSLKLTAFIQASNTCLKTNTYSRCYNQQTKPDGVKKIMADFIKSAVSEACAPYDWGPTERKPFCV